MTLAPEIHGAVPIHSAPEAFLEKFRQRVSDGLLSGRPHRRSNYIVARADARELQIQAVGWLTAINVGLNELDLDLRQSGMARYRVHYWRWASYVIGLSAVLGVVGLVLLLAFDLRTYVTHAPGAMIPGLSLDQNLMLLWAIVLFWGFVWPWLLILLHKGPLRRLVTHLIKEIDGQAAPAARQ